MTKNDKGTCCCCPSYASVILASLVALLSLSLSIYAYAEDHSGKGFKASMIGISSLFILPYIFVGAYKNSATPRIVLFSTHLIQWFFAAAYVMYITLKAEDGCANDSQAICDLGNVVVSILVGLWALYNIFVQVGLWHFVEEAKDNKVKYSLEDEMNNMILILMK